MPTTAGNIDPIDPVFISYRQADGTPVTTELAWLLRSAGVPVWRDRDDLPPGDTDERLRQAIDEGISGAVFVVTVGIGASRIVRQIEAPRILALHTADPAFALGIVNNVEDTPSHLDYSAPDRLLEVAPPILSGVDQHSATRTGLLETVRKLVFHRIAMCRDRVRDDDGTFRLSVQTRNTPQVYDRTDSHLDVRVRPSTHERLPSPGGLVDLRDTIGLLPDSVTRADARRVLLTGGAHLSVALALGAALPSSRVGQLDVLDQRQLLWQSGGEADFGGNEHLRLVAEGQSEGGAAGRPQVAVYIDLTGTESDSAFERFLEEADGRFVTWAHFGQARNGLLDNAAAREIAAEAAAHIRHVSTTNGNAEVHLLLRCPFPLAVLIGRLTNTLRLVAYEWDDSDAAFESGARPMYVPVLRIRASASAGVIEQVLISD